MKYNQVANILAERKLKLGISQLEISKRSTVPQSTVHRILSGTHQRAKMDDIFKISVALGVNSVSFDFNDRQGQSNTK
jgi:transcriptional regulator with XRE-family HTH domain